MTLVAAICLFVVGAWLGFTIGWTLGVITCAPHIEEEGDANV